MRHGLDAHSSMSVEVRQKRVKPKLPRQMTESRGTRAGFTHQCCIRDPRSQWRMCSCNRRPCHCRCRRSGKVLTRTHQYLQAQGRQTVGVRHVRGIRKRTSGAGALPHKLEVQPRAALPYLSRSPCPCTQVHMCSCNRPEGPCNWRRSGKGSCRTRWFLVAMVQVAKGEGKT